MGKHLPIADDIAAWIKDYATNAGMKTLVVGVSGGIDSAVVSTLCGLTGMPTIAVTMPIRQRPDLHELSLVQATWLMYEFSNVRHVNIDLTDTFGQFESTLSEFKNNLGFANSRSRLRMMTLYQIAQSSLGLVVGTGNRVEDFGVGFYTKYGDGGVDISPIANLNKTEVWSLGASLGIDMRIISAAPTDGLWDDGRVDQDQLGGLDYATLEHLMDLDESGLAPANNEEANNLELYRKIRARNLHKMLPIPVYMKK